MTATENLQSSTHPVPSAEDVVISGRGLTKVFKGGLPLTANPNCKVDAPHMSGARASGRFSVRQQQHVRPAISLCTVKRRERRAPYSTLRECQLAASKIDHC